jgi:hypothetical protein
MDLQLQSAPSASPGHVVWSLPPSWREWTGLLMVEPSATETPDSQAGPEEQAISLWLMFTNGANDTAAPSSSSSVAKSGPLRLETAFTVLNSYTLSGALDPTKRTIHFTQTCLPTAQATTPWQSRDFTATITASVSFADRCARTACVLCALRFAQTFRCCVLLCFQCS